MAYGLQIWDASGNSVFDSSTALGGVPVGFISGATHAGSHSFTTFAGYTMEAVVIGGYTSGDELWEYSGMGLTISHASGYPEITVSSYTPTVMLIVY